MSTQRLGHVQQWDDERGFGFVVDAETKQRLFLHISAFVRKPRKPPVVGDRIGFVSCRDEQGRARAEQAVLLGSAGLRHRIASPRLRSAALCLATLMLIICGFWHYRSDRQVVAIALWYAAWSGISFLNYASDKAKARNNEWRTSERFLHLIDIIAGWPGGLAAQRILRHKSSKRSFLLVFWITVVVNVIALIWLINDNPIRTVQHWLPTLFQALRA